MDNLIDYIDSSVHSRKVNDLIADIDKGKISIPRFQRQFVWSLEKSAALLDSILKDYPAGALTLWKTSTALGDERRVGNVTIGKGEGNPYNYIIDGQQRLATLYACMKGAHGVDADDFVGDGNKAKGKDADFREIYVDLSADPKKESIVITYKEKKDREDDKDNPRKGCFVSVVEFYQMKFDEMKNLPNDYGSKIAQYQERVRIYEFPLSQVTEEASYVVVTEIFTRMNTKGEPLGMFEIMVAKTYDVEKGFDLLDKYSEFQDHLESLHYGRLPKDLVLRVAAMLLKGSYSSEAVYEITRNEFTENWGLICKSIDDAITLFRGTYGVKYLALLPHSPVITTLFSYFHAQKSGKGIGELSDKQNKDLEEFFWRAALSGRYASSFDSKIEKDKSKMMEILERKSPKYDTGDNWSVDVRLDTITDNDYGFFSLGNHYIKAILSIMYVGNSPLNFGRDSAVFENSLSLQRANSSNYHHFFPKSHLKNKGVKYKCIENHVLNITLITQKDNQGYSDKAPREYLKGYKQSALVSRLKTHLIGGGKGNVLKDWGIEDDDYDVFIEKRAKLLIKKIKERITFDESVGDIEDKE